MKKMKKILKVLYACLFLISSISAIAGFVAAYLGYEELAEKCLIPLCIFALITFIFVGIPTVLEFIFES